MRSSLYRQVNNGVKEWWWYKQLRKNGQLKEARVLERSSIRDAVKTARTAKENNGTLVKWPHGWTLYISPTSRMSGFSETAHAEVIPLCRALKVRELDLSKMYDEIFRKDGTRDEVKSAEHDRLFDRLFDCTL